MKSWKVMLGLGLGLASLGVAANLGAADGFSIENGRLLDAKGNDFVLRGLNVPHAWYTSRTQSSIPQIADVGANCVRVVLSNGVRWHKTSASEVASIIELCKQHQLICMLEVHDTTGFGDEQGASTLAQAAAYWQEIAAVLQGEEAYVLINIGNEPWGNTDSGGWLAATQQAVSDLRAAGLRHVLVVDGPNWGQDWQFLLRDNAEQLLAGDPQGNLLFSVHMYQVFNTDAKVESYLRFFDERELPLIVGEFGPDHQGEEVAEGAIFELCDTLGIGYLGWSWSGNSADVANLDIVLNFDPTQLSPWGELLINGEHGLRATAQICSVFLEDSPPVQSDELRHPQGRR